ncbi:MAG TPA: sugar ABC transporter ATP-binding protein [Hyphomicrobiales bacterium]|nr:sugar ABC transporter ATP-binding protein [Hyphomicrobiales bacterium]
MSDAPALEMRGISKAFFGVPALRGIDLAAAAGTVHAIVGENGAGKSTLMAILAGVVAADAGEIRIGGEPLPMGDSEAARQRGISVVYQEFNLIPDLSVAANVFLHREPTRHGLLASRRMRQETARLLAEVGAADIDPRLRAGQLGVAQQQLVEVARALALRPRILVMDEPTAALAAQEQARLLDLARTLRARGTTILYISHRLEEVFAIADRITVLKDGRHVATLDTAATDRDEIVRLMVGRDLARGLYPERPAAQADRGTPALAVSHLSWPGVLDDVSLDVQRGEIVGLAGLVGAGRTSLARAIFGAEPAARGEIRLDGRPAHIRSPRAATRLGLGLLSEDRKGEGLAMNLEGVANIAAVHLPTTMGLVRRAAERRQAVTLAERVRLAPQALKRAVRTLSGGNQQKVVLAKWLAARARVLILDEPTRGIDVGAKAEIYAIMRELAAEGVGILFISSELPEILGVSDRILVMRRGRIVAEMPGPGATEEAVMRAAVMEDEPA